MIKEYRVTVRSELGIAERNGYYIRAESEEAARKLFYKTNDRDVKVDVQYWKEIPSFLGGSVEF